MSFKESMLSEFIDVIPQEEECKALHQIIDCQYFWQVFWMSSQWQIVSSIKVHVSLHFLYSRSKIEKVDFKEKKFCRSLAYMARFRFGRIRKHIRKLNPLLGTVLCRINYLAESKQAYPFLNCTQMKRKMTWWLKKHVETERWSARFLIRHLTARAPLSVESCVQLARRWSLGKLHFKKVGFR